MFKDFSNINDFEIKTKTKTKTRTENKDLLDKIDKKQVD